MKLTTRGRYGMRAMIDLAEHQGAGAVSVQSIAQRQQISESYLEQLIRKMKQDGLVCSVRGAGGGYRLARDASAISVGDILRCLEGGTAAVDCPATTGSDCSSADVCVTKFVWKRINDAIAMAVDTLMLSELAAESRGLKRAERKEDAPGLRDRPLVDAAAKPPRWSEADREAPPAARACEPVKRGKE